MALQVKDGLTQLAIGRGLCLAGQLDRDAASRLQRRAAHVPEGAGALIAQAATISASRSPVRRTCFSTIFPSVTRVVGVPSKMVVVRLVAVATRSSAALKPTSTTAPSSPPVRELSGPITAFWTTLLRSSMTIRSNEFSWASCRLPANRMMIARPR